MGTRPHQLVSLLQPFQGRHPSNDNELAQLMQTLRRQAHITEGTPGNIAEALQGPMRQAPPGAYFANPHRPPHDEQQTYFGWGWGGQPHAQQHQQWQGYTPPQMPPTPPQWGSGGGHQTETGWPTSGAGFYQTDQEEDDGTDTDTSSDSGNEDLVGQAELVGMTDPDVAAHLYFQYRKAKKVWRRSTHKPVRKFRRKFRKFGKGHGKVYRDRGKGSGKGHSIMFSEEDVYTFLSGKGKGHRSGSSGKGFGRKGNPKDRDGNVMTCRVCGSEDHFAARCPKGSGKGSSGPSFFTQTTDYTPPWRDAGLQYDRPLQSAHGMRPLQGQSGQSSSSTDARPLHLPGF